MDRKDRDRLLTVLLATFHDPRVYVDDVEIKCKECQAYQDVLVEKETLDTVKIQRLRKILGYLTLESLLTDALDLGGNDEL